ncbi:LysR substrate-binding domain-containing protein [Microbacterium sp. STN6]|uniref:LysR family transcriptional regulator n=1 Tax=Microbacterium sp. STN6 TaxID=2995588 RepID=UPI002260FBF7|nr:LysR substrate-binding domain-containing protein [Microbacterium sp. STN6]MCX7522184.1 LysR substrate-binding domain-containing protein [Microbacterium sp. STN6]
MFDPVLLRSFLALADTRSFTRAAAQLGISQPTVSQHVRRLEDAAGRLLVTRDTREVRLTDNGDAMAGFARTILAAHAEAESYFSGSAMKGRLRFGTADDLAITQLPRILRHFRQLHPQINLELTVGQSGPLQRRLKGGQLDLIFIKQGPSPTEGTVVSRDILVWVGQEKTLIEDAAPVPLVAYQAPSMSRQTAIDALEGAGRTWKITCNTRDVNSTLAAVRAGLGIAVFPQTLIPDDLVKVTRRFGLPDLGEITFSLLANPSAPKEPIEALTAAIIRRDLRRPG